MPDSLGLVLICNTSRTRVVHVSSVLKP